MSNEPQRMTSKQYAEAFDRHDTLMDRLQRMHITERDPWPCPKCQGEIDNTPPLEFHGLAMREIIKVQCGACGWRGERILAEFREYKFRE